MSWFAGLPFLEKLFIYIAAPSTVILVLQTLLLFVGGDSDDGGDAMLESDSSGIDFEGLEPDADLSLDSGELAAADLDDVQTLPEGGDVHSSAGLRFLTTRGIVAFLTVSGWTGICSMELGVPSLLAIILAVHFGAAAMIGIAYLVRAMMGLQSSGTVQYRKALGMIGDVYLPIPANGGGVGKVSLALGGVKEYDAVTTEETAIKTGELVRVTDIIRDGIMVVEREPSGE